MDNSSEVPNLYKIPKEDCIKGHLYRIFSRNLISGVYDGEGGFIGVREKFGREYLFTEFHYDNGAPFGTVYPKEDLGMIPDHLDAVEHYATVDLKTGRPVAFDRPVMDGGKGWYFIDTGEGSKEIHPQSPPNSPLFDWLREKDVAIWEERAARRAARTAEKEAASEEQNKGQSAE